MKHLFLVLSILSCMHCFAQDPQLLKNTWYLQNVIIDGQDNFPPVNSEVNSVPVYFTQDGFDTVVCNSLLGFIEYNNQTFSFPQPLETTLILCNLQINEDFESFYFSFYSNAQPSFYNYEITTDSNGNKSLIVTSENDDLAIYGDQELGVLDQELVKLVLSPNPVKNTLHLSLAQGEIIKARIYNVLGKEVFTQKGNIQELDLESLEAGFYFLKIETDNGLITKKIVKL